MPLVPAKCPGCGGEIQVDNSRKEAFCSYCGNKFLVESAVNYYNTKNEYHIEHADIKMEDSSGLETKLKNAESYLVQHKDYEKAEELFKAIAEEFAGDWRAWWGVARVKTREFTGIATAEVRGASDKIEQRMRESFSTSLADVGRYVQKALNVADAQKKEELQGIWEAYQSRCKEAVDSYLSRHMNEWRETDRQAAQLESALDRQERLIKHKREHLGTGPKDLPDVICFILSRIGILLIILSLIFHWDGILFIGVITQAGWLYEPISNSRLRSRKRELEEEVHRYGEISSQFYSTNNITMDECFRSFERGLEG